MIWRDSGVFIPGHSGFLGVLEYSSDGKSSTPIGNTDKSNYTYSLPNFIKVKVSPLQAMKFHRECGCKGIFTATAQGRSRVANPTLDHLYTR